MSLVISLNNKHVIAAMLTIPIETDSVDEDSAAQLKTINFMGMALNIKHMPPPPPQNCRNSNP